MNGFPAISAARAGSPGGVGYFGVKITGYEGKAITLVIRRMAGMSGSAIFTDTGMDVMTVWGDCDCYVKIRGQDFSTIARNMQLQAYPPVPEGGPPATTDFSVFWVVDAFSDFGSVPDDAWGAAGPIGDQVRKFRQDHQNQLGVAIGETQYHIRGHKLTTYPMFPVDLDPDDLRRGGPGNGFDILRRMTARYYFDGCVTNQNNVDDYKESSAPVAKDVTADRPNGNAQLRLYDWDAPSVVYPNGQVDRSKDHDIRGRANFVEWTTYVDDDGTENRTSADLAWYFRGAWHWDAQAFKLTMQGAPGDNEVAPGTTPLTFDLNPSTDPDITITGFDKVTAANSDPFVDVQIFGNFPPSGTGCEYQAYLVAGTADSSGDPTDGLDGDFYPALGANRINQKTLLARFPLRRQGEVWKTFPLPLPAKTYQIKVVQGTKYAQKGDFTLTENPFVQWKLVGFQSDGIHVTVVALSYDGAGNVVTRPGGARPVFQQIAGVKLSLFDNYGRYGEYWGRALVFNLGESGPVTIQVSGGGGLPDTQIFKIP